MTILIFLIISYILLSVSLYMLFPKIGIDKIKGLIPGINFIEWAKAIGRPAWWAALLLIPIVGIFIYAAMCVDLMRSFGKMSFWDSFLSVVYAPAAFGKLAMDDKAKYGGPVLEQEQAYFESIEAAKEAGKSREVKRLLANNPYKKSGGREWAEAVIFAVFAAAFIRMFLIEAYVIPTPSMEGSLLTGDYLFVSKAHYGIRTPETVLMIPLLHNRIPILNRESYIKSPNIPAVRLPALEKIDNLDPIVFNYPEGDSVYVTPTRVWSVYDVRRNHPGIPKDLLKDIERKRNKLITRPIDKRDHYVKRAIGIPGDSLQIRDGQVYINGAALKNAPKIQFFHKVEFPTRVGEGMLLKMEDWGIQQNEGDRIQAGNQMYYLVLNEEQKEKVQGMDDRIKITKIKYKELQDLFVKNGMRRNTLFPHSDTYFKDWTVDDFGPIWVPEAGATIELTPQNIDLYYFVILHHEGNESVVKRNGKLVINGQEVSKYTFKQDYYWGMGDNRHSSEDSRYFGYIPHSHIVGKPWFIWFSANNGIRWNRIFTGAMKLD